MKASGNADSDSISPMKASRNADSNGIPLMKATLNANLDGIPLMKASSNGPALLSARREGRGEGFARGEGRPGRGTPGERDAAGERYARGEGRPEIMMATPGEDMME
jgi:hypothetical protein